jgi:uncharacterized protein YjgD (DUF1641 family)
MVNQQRIKAQGLEDLVADLSLVGKDMYDSAIVELENQKVELDPEELKILGIRILKNIRNLNGVMTSFESASDFIRDAGPIVNDMIIDFTKRLQELDQKGYFEFFGEFGRLIDNIISHFSAEDVKMLADNIVSILQTVKNMTQPEMLNSINNAVKVYDSMETQNVPEYSVFKLIRELNKPEMKRALGFMVTFMKNLANPGEKENVQNQQKT